MFYRCTISSGVALISPQGGRAVSSCICPDCGRAFTTRSGFLEHMKRHMGRYRYNCNLCQKGFMNRQHYLGHMNMHENRKPFACQLCKKTFTLKSNAMSHQKTCSGVTRTPGRRRLYPELYIPQAPAHSPGASHSSSDMTEQPGI